MIGSIFDPLGMVDLVKLILKSFLSIPASMDETLPEGPQQILKKFEEDVPMLATLKWPRACLGNILYGYCDASQEAYGFCIYIANEDSDTMTMLCAKSKIVPITPTRTIPELELAALHLLLNAVAAVMNKREIKAVRIFSDSMINLHRLNNQPNRYSAFTSTRLFAIQKIATRAQMEFFHVASEENPADKYSRVIDIPLAV